jgi:hypothetical protein
MAKGVGRFWRLNQLGQSANARSSRPLRTSSLHTRPKRSAVARRPAVAKQSERLDHATRMPRVIYGYAAMRSQSGSGGSGHV